MKVKMKDKMAKEWYNDSVILFLKRRKLYIYENKYLKPFYKINKLKKLHINYVIIDNLEIYEKNYEDNNYSLYYLKYEISDILNNIKFKLKERIDKDE